MKKNVHEQTYCRAVAPLWNAWGTKCHSLLLNVSEVVDVPYTSKKMWRLAIGNELPSIKDKEEILRQKALNGTMSKTELDTIGALRYPVADIREIRVECRWLQNVVVVCLLHQKDVTFYIQNRECTDEIRETFKTLYPKLYKEKGFDKSTIAGFLKRL